MSLILMRNDNSDANTVNYCHHEKHNNKKKKIPHAPNDLLAYTLQKKNKTFHFCLVFPIQISKCS